MKWHGFRQRIRRELSEASAMVEDPTKGSAMTEVTQQLFTPGANARHSDPDESHEAAASVKNLTEKQEAVLLALTMAGVMTEFGVYGASDQRIAGTYATHGDAHGWPRQSESGLRTRRSELVKLGKVEKVGTTKLETGRSAALWAVTNG